MAEPEPRTCPACVLTLRSPSKGTLEMFIKVPGTDAFIIPVSLSLAKFIAAEASAFVARVDKS